MTLTTRRVLAGVFIVAFFIIAPITIYYARGYRYAWTSGTVTPTGTLIVSTEPSKAQLRLNGNVIDGETPLTLTALDARRYAIELSKDGYHTWKKALPVRNGEATFVSDIRLLKNALPTQVVSAANTPLAASPNGNLIAMIAGAEDGALEASILNFTTGRTTSIETRFQSTPTLVAWSTDSRLLAIGDATMLIIVDTSTGGQTTIEPPRGARIARWSTIKPGTLTMLADDGFFEASASSRWNVQKSNEELPTGTLLDFWYQQARRIALVENNEEYSLSLRGSDGTSNSIKLPNIQPDSYAGGWNDILVFRTNDSGLAVGRYTESSYRPMIDVPHISAIALSETLHTIAFATEFEIWTYDTAAASRELLTRLGTPITAISLFSDYSYVFYATENAVWAIERDGRDLRNNWRLASLTSLSNIVLHQNNETLYLFGTIGTLNGVFRYDL